MTNEASVIPLDLYRQAPTPLQLEEDRLLFLKSQRRGQILSNIAAGFICALALCGLLLVVHGLGWLP